MHMLHKEKVKNQTISNEDKGMKMYKSNANDKEKTYEHKMNEKMDGYKLGAWESI